MARPGITAFSRWLRAQWRSAAVAVRRVVTLTDTPERIARGCAAGIGTAFLPMLGQTLVGMAVAWCVRGSVLAAVPWSWITNPLTTLPLWYACYRLGAALLPGDEVITWNGLRGIIEQFQGMSFLDGLLHGVEVLGGVLLPMLVGSLIIGAVCAAPTYWLVRRAVTALQARRAARAAHWKTRLVPGSPGGKL